MHGLYLDGQDQHREHLVLQRYLQRDNQILYL